MGKNKSPNGQRQDGPLSGDNDSKEEGLTEKNPCHLDWCQHKDLAFEGREARCLPNSKAHQAVKYQPFMGTMRGRELVVNV